MRLSHNVGWQGYSRGFVQHAARLRTMCAYQRTCVLQGDEAVKALPIDNESNAVQRAL
jgi:hypothetical protein